MLGGWQKEKGMKVQPNSKTATKERPIMSLLYHPSTIHVHKVTLSNWSLLQACTEVAKIFSWPPLITYKWDTNIQDMLAQSKLWQPARNHSLQPREMQNVTLHPHRHQHQHPRTKIKDEHHQTVQLPDIQHRVHCSLPKCAKLYIGETGRTLNTRFKEHLADIKHHRDKPVANHLNQAGHSIHNICVKGL